MTIKEVIKEGIDILKPNIESAWLEAHVLLGYVLNKERTFLISHDDEAITKQEYDKYMDCLNKRISGIPLQYITGNQEFMSLNFNVDPSVLIPRPETEILVEEILKYVSSSSENEHINILDIGTGSGCISVSIAHNSEKAMITAVDISKDALDTAKKNAEKHGITDRIRFIESNLFSGIEKKEFDVIVSNPPYIETKIISSLQTEVKDYEPMQALDGGSDGLDCIKRIIEDAHLYLKSGGLLAFEVGHDQAERTASIIAENGRYQNIRIIKDYSGIDRVVTANFKFD
ncbi:MAG: peptide chain release factor N(5)-glutamine methyltransferase [Ignavibacteriales bacterium]